MRQKKALWFARNHERRVGSVPKWMVALLAAALCVQAGYRAMQPRPVAVAAALPAPLPANTLRAASIGEPLVLAQWLTLYLQAFDNQPGISIPFRELDYGRVVAWLGTALSLDPQAQYPLMMASQLYGQVDDAAKQRRMCDFVQQEFLAQPDLRWRWLAHCAVMAKHRLKDMPLALRYAEDIARHAGRASNWARQMRIFILEDMGETEGAAVLLGGLLVGGEITDPKELHFLTERLEKLKTGEKLTMPSKNRQP